MSRNPLRPFLEAQGFVVLDGGLATALETAGHDLGTDLWSARLLRDEPDAIREVHAAYLSAGADCVTTASYQASVAGFMEAGAAEAEAHDLLLRSVTLATEARDRFWNEKGGGGSRLRPLVAASVGPYGAYLADGSEYHGRYGIGAEGLRVFHAGRFEALAASGADLLACETIPSRVEAEVLLDLLDETTDVWAWLSFSCRDERSLSDGTPFREAVRRSFGHPRVAAVGVNCTAPRFVGPLLASVGESGRLPLLAYPNSGETYDADTKCWSGSADGWLDEAPGWIEAGASVLGGCCRTRPEDISALRATATATILRVADHPSPT